MTVVDRPWQAEGTGPDSPELLFPEARRRRKKRWLIAGGSFLTVLGLVVGLLSGIYGRGTNQSNYVSPAGDRLGVAIQKTEAAGTALVTMTTRETFVPASDGTLDRVTIAHVRFQGPVAVVLSQGSFPVYYFGHTFYFAAVTMPGLFSQWAEQSTPPYNPFAPLLTPVGRGSAVTQVSSSADGTNRLIEYRVIQPATSTAWPTGTIRKQPETVLVWVDADGRIVHIRAPRITATAPSSCHSEAPPTIPIASRSVGANPNGSTTTTVPSKVNTSLCGAYVSRTDEDVTVADFGVPFNPSPPSASPLRAFG